MKKESNLNTFVITPDMMWDMIDSSWKDLKAGESFTVNGLENFCKEFFALGFHTAIEKTAQLLTGIDSMEAQLTQLNLKNEQD